MLKMIYLFTNMIKKTEKKVSTKKKEPTKVANVYPKKTNNANLFVGLRVQIVNEYKEEIPSDLSQKQKKLLQSLFNDLNNEIAKGLFGKLVEKNGAFVVEFEKEYSFTCSYDEFFKENIYYTFNDIQNIQSTRNEEESKIDELCGFIYSIKKKEIERELGDIEDIKTRTTELKSRMEDYKREVVRAQKTITENKIILKKLLSTDAFSSIDKDMINISVQKMMKNPKIESVCTSDNDNGETFVIITTKDLIYSSPRCSYNIGQFKLKIGSTGKPEAVNITKFYGDNATRFHPCVNGSFGMCLGAQVENHVMKLIKAGDLNGVATTLINFLEEPNYGSPYISDIEFYAAQPVKIKPKTEIDWFDRNLWDGLHFDYDLAKKTENEFISLLKKK